MPYRMRPDERARANNEGPALPGRSEVESPGVQTEGANDMQSIARNTPSMTTEPSDRRLGAQSRPGLGDGRPQGQEGQR